MKPEKLLYAMNDIDIRFLLEAREESAAPRRHRRPGVLIAAVIALMGLAVTAFAAEEITGWFKQYFSRPDAPLTPGQVEYIETHENIISDLQQSDDFVIELKSFLSSADGMTTYVTLGITAPEDIFFEPGQHVCGKGMEITDNLGNQPFMYSIQRVDDADGLDTTHNIVLIIEPTDPEGITGWNIHIDGLYMDRYDAEYERELIETKYAGQKDFMFTPEESARIHGFELLAEGKWDFRINVSASDGSFVELLEEPLTVPAVVYRNEEGKIDTGENQVEDIRITSFTLRALDAILTYDVPYQVGLAVDRQGVCAFAVMKDGTQICLRNSHMGIIGMIKLKPDSPIILEEVDHIYLLSGAKLEIPQP